MLRSEDTETDLSIWILTEIPGIFSLMASTHFLYQKEATPESDAIRENPANSDEPGFQLSCF